MAERVISGKSIVFNKAYNEHLATCEPILTPEAAGKLSLLDLYVYINENKKNGMTQPKPKQEEIFKSDEIKISKEEQELWQLPGEIQIAINSCKNLNQLSNLYKKYSKLQLMNKFRNACTKKKEELKKAN